MEASPAPIPGRRFIYVIFEISNAKMGQKSFFSAKREARSAKRAQALEALEVWRICKPRSGSPMKERSRLRECDAHPEGIITMRFANRPIDIYIYIYIHRASATA